MNETAPVSASEPPDLVDRVLLALLVHDVLELTMAGHIRLG
jgi:hypothetical protein